VDRLAEARGLVVWDVGFRREAGRDHLTVALERSGGIDAEALTKFAESLSRELDETDAVPGDVRYILEVTSPGAERRLRTAQEFSLCAGRMARVTFKDGRNPLEGPIVDADEDGVAIESDQATVRIGYDEISQARLMVPGV
jgi:ribosome maturation factor RimP